MIWEEEEIVFFLMHVHLVFVTKYWRNVFTKPILEELRSIFRNVRKDFAEELAEFKGEKDHVHLLVNYPPEVSVSKLVNRQYIEQQYAPIT